MRKLKIILNNDSTMVEIIREQIKANDGYCPCRLNKTPDTKCMCKDFRKQSSEGECHCGLYVKVWVDD